MNATFANSCRPHRKQLSEQLDRFDSILDGLSEGLNGAISDAVRDGTRLAIKDAVIELLTDPTLRAKLHQAAAPEPAPVPTPVCPTPSLWNRFTQWVQGAFAAVGRLFGKIASGCGQAAHTALGAIQQSVQLVRHLGSLNRLLWIGAGVGVTAATLSIVAPHFLSAAVAGLSTALAAMVVQAGVWTQRSLRFFSLN